MESYRDYLRVMYARMGQIVPPNGVVIEIGARAVRGVETPNFIPHRYFMAIDRDPSRPGVTLDVLHTPVYGDVILSTCVLHHTAKENIPRLLGNLRAPLLMFTGPTADTHEPYGDHLWHLEEKPLRRWLKDLGYTMTWEPSGLTEPKLEAFVVARKA